MSLGLCQGGLTFSSKLWFSAKTHKCGVWQQHGAMSPNYARHRREADERSCGSTTEEKRYGTELGPDWKTHSTSKAPGAAPLLSPHIPSTKPQSKAADLFDIQSLFEEDVIAELCSRLEAFPRSDRAEGLASLLGACVEFGLEAHSPPVLTLMNECLELLSNRDIGVAQLCRLGEVVCALEGRRSRVLTEVLDCVRAAVEEDVVSPSEAVMVYSLLTRFREPASQQQTRILSALHTDTRRLVHRLKAGHVSDILQSLLKLQQTQVDTAAASSLIVFDS